MTTSPLKVSVEYVQRPGILQDRIDDDLFLIDTTENRIHALNMMAAAIWELLAEPGSADDLCAVFREEFPQVSPSRLKRDIKETLTSMSKIRILRTL